MRYRLWTLLLDFKKELTTTLDKYILVDSKRGKAPRERKPKMTTAYTTKTDAIEQYIEPALGEHAADFDMDAIFHDFFEYDEDARGFVEREDVDFWDVAQAHDTTAA